MISNASRKQLVSQVKFSQVTSELLRCANWTDSSGPRDHLDDVFIVFLATQAASIIIREILEYLAVFCS